MAWICPLREGDQRIFCKSVAGIAPPQPHLARTPRRPQPYETDNKPSLANDDDEEDERRLRWLGAFEATTRKNRSTDIGIVRGEWQHVACTFKLVQEQGFKLFVI